MARSDIEQEQEDDKAVGVTSISFTKIELERYKNHAKSEGMAFSKMIKALFEQDMQDKDECKGSPERILDRIRLKQKRMLLVNDNRLENLKIDDLFDE